MTNRLRPFSFHSAEHLLHPLAEDSADAFSHRACTSIKKSYVDFQERNSSRLITADILTGMDPSGSRTSLKSAKKSTATLSNLLFRFYNLVFKYCTT